VSGFLRPAWPTDAGKTGDILWAFISDTDWMPCLYTAAETISFCGQMIDRGWVTVAVLDDQVQGFIARDGAEIHALYLAQSAKRRGLGRMLLEDAKAQSKHLKLWTFQANTSAQQFYLREGFVEAARTDGADNDEKLPDIHYIWPEKPEKPKKKAN